jgi:hypothetical protein
MKRVWLVALSAALSAATMTITTDGAMARRGGGGVHAGGHGGLHGGNINRHPGGGAHFAGYRRPGGAGWHGNYAGWRGGNWGRGVGWGVGAAGLAVGAAAASAYGYDGTYAPAYSYPACGYPDYPPC